MGALFGGGLYYVLARRSVRREADATQPIALETATGNA
jgi:hypothetical protein